MGLRGVKKLVALHLLPVFPIDDIIWLQRRRFGSREERIHHERAVTNCDLEKLASSNKQNKKTSYMLARVLNIHIVHTRRC